MLLRLGFASAVRNIGDGPLIVSGRRKRVEIPTMTADQRIKGADARRAVGRLRYVHSHDREHWHLLGFERYTSRCRLGQPDRLRLVEGISVGYGDDYPANLEGQSLRLTGLAAGRYVLVHRVNVRQRLRETDYSNNAASLLLRLRWRAGAPRLRVLRRCPDSERCLMTNTAPTGATHDNGGERRPVA